MLHSCTTFLLSLLYIDVTQTVDVARFKFDARHGYLIRWFPSSDYTRIKCALHVSKLVFLHDWEVKGSKSQIKLPKLRCYRCVALNEKPCCEGNMLQPARLQGLCSVVSFKYIYAKSNSTIIGTVSCWVSLMFLHVFSIASKYATASDFLSRKWVRKNIITESWCLSVKELD